VIDSDTERRRILATLLPSIASEGLLDAVLAVEALLAAMAPHGVQRWRGLSDAELLDHLECHVLEVQDDIVRRDDGTGHLTAAHAAARAVMALARALERSR
jgi:hypothetical protein